MRRSIHSERNGKNVDTAVVVIMALWKAEDG